MSKVRVKSNIGRSTSRWFSLRSKKLPPHTWEAHPLANPKEIRGTFIFTLVVILALGILSVSLLSGEHSIGQAVITGAVSASTCTDSDNGANYTFLGTTVGAFSGGTESQSYSDNCNWDGRVQEYFCFNESVQYNLYNCTLLGGNYKCDNGACVCTPSCTGQCGVADGCGGSCNGNCQDNFHYCKQGSCLPYGCAGVSDYANSTPCPGDQTNLTANGTFSLVSSCTEAKKCEFTCKSGYVFNNGFNNGQCTLNNSCNPGNHMENDQCVSDICPAGQVRNESNQCVTSIPCETLGQIGCNDHNPIKHLACDKNVCLSSDCGLFMEVVSGNFMEVISGNGFGSASVGLCSSNTSCSLGYRCVMGPKHPSTTEEGVCISNDFLNGLFASCVGHPLFCLAKDLFIDQKCTVGEGACNTSSDCIYGTTCEAFEGLNFKVCKGQNPDCIDDDDDLYTSNLKGTCTLMPGMNFGDCNDDDPSINVCAQGYHCANKQCVLDCESCLPGAKKCSSDKRGVLTCVAKNNYCNEWVSEPCRGDLICKDATCQTFWCLSDNDCGDYGEGASCVNGKCQQLALSAEPIVVELRSAINAYTLADQEVQKGQDYIVQLIIKPDIKLPNKHLVVTTVTSAEGKEVARFWQIMPELPIKQTETVSFQHRIPDTTSINITTNIFGEFNTAWTELVPAKEVSYAVS